MQGGILQSARLALVGAFIGLTGLVPGISGGTVAVIAGIYDELIGSLRGLLRRRVEWRKQMLFLLPLSAGCVAAVFLFAQVIEYMLLVHPIQMNMFFVGLIVGTVPFLYRRAVGKQFNPSYILPLAISFTLLVMLVLAQPEPRAVITSLDLKAALLVFAAGFISSATAIIPGISGSVVLLLIGMYSTLIVSIRDFNLPVLLILAVGALFGLLTFTRLIYFLLQRFYHLTYFSIIGLILGSAVNIWPGISQGLAGFIDGLIMIAGFCLAMLFHGKFGMGKKPDGYNANE